jgi:hypothetical protein
MNLSGLPAWWIKLLTIDGMQKFIAPTAEEVDARKVHSKPRPEKKNMWEGIRSFIGGLWQS